LPEPFLNWTAGWWKRCDGGERRIDGWRFKGYPTETVWIFDARTNVPGIAILVSAGTGGCGAFLVERLPAEAEPTRREGDQRRSCWNGCGKPGILHQRMTERSDAFAMSSSTACFSRSFKSIPR
jgi:hypothetical protein